MMRAARPQPERDDAPFHRIVSPDGKTWCALHREGAGYLLRFPALADFEIAPRGRQVRCRPVPGVRATTCEHLFLNQVLPHLLSGNGRLVFHASAIDLGRGAIAFLGESGRGKSTLAAAFAAAGHGFLTDEVLVLSPRRQGYAALPGHASLRLWRDSRRAIAARAGAMAGQADAGKVRLRAGPALTYCDRSRPLLAALFLGPGRARAPRLTRLPASASVAQWLGNAFLLDPAQRHRLAAHFRGVADIAARVEAYRLDYPRRFGALGEVREYVLSHFQGPDAKA